jgi:hypothetical protein
MKDGEGGYLFEAFVLLGVVIPPNSMCFVFFFTDIIIFFLFSSFIWFLSSYNFTALSELDGREDREFLKKMVGLVSLCRE